MKVVGLLVLVLVVFFATVIGALAASGNLTRESIERLLKPPPEPVSATEPADDVGPVARALRTRREELDKREAALKVREERINQMLSDLQELRADIEAIQQQIRAALDAEDKDRADRLKEVAASLAGMKPDNAARTLEDWPVEDAAEVLCLIKERDRGKILDGMDPVKAAVLLRALQERKL